MVGNGNVKYQFDWEEHEIFKAEHNNKQVLDIIATLPKFDWAEEEVADSSRPKREFRSIVTENTTVYQGEWASISGQD